MLFKWLTEPYPTSTHTSNPSTWQQLVVGAGSAAGSTAAVVSEESMKCLRYCVSWLQYAIRHLGQQMSLLRGFLVSLATNSNQQQQQPMVLATIKKDMVSTLRKVIDIITCYASNALPYQAKATIRGTILNLPSRWASLYEETNTANDDVIQQQTNTNESYKQEDVALRLLAFGQESSDMLGSIHTVIDDTIQRAESWLERLRLINPMSSVSAASSTSTMAQQLPALSINQHKSKGDFSGNDEDDDFYNVLLPPILNLHISSSSSSTTTTATALKN
ncbi:hypothetical protein MUCCIDRAFT_79024 [Mucor lusitanicus CBS 277.49]|uniref:Transcription factor Opi1 n=1 Tax=Mucor lusitanicus CBS 277.49 TaxID=747725 RepID=A0A168N7Q4_MUCCL|nr:hypothetical protein MUCCIDRAFT_79024 [Mucor lusitanicus CBS 277.49]